MSECLKFKYTNANAAELSNNFQCPSYPYSKNMYGNKSLKILRFNYALHPIRLLLKALLNEYVWLYVHSSVHVAVASWCTFRKLEIEQVFSVSLCKWIVVNQANTNNAQLFDILGKNSSFPIYNFRLSGYGLWLEIMQKADVWRMMRWIRMMVGANLGSSNRKMCAILIGGLIRLIEVFSFVAVRNHITQSYPSLMILTKCWMNRCLTIIESRRVISPFTYKDIEFLYRRSKYHHFLELQNNVQSMSISWAKVICLDIKIRPLLQCASVMAKSNTSFITTSGKNQTPWKKNYSETPKGGKI